MKKLLVLLILLSGILFPLACSDNNSNKGTGPALPGSGGSTPGSGGIATSTPNPSAGTLTPVPAYQNVVGLSAAPNGMYYDSGTNILAVAEGTTITGNITAFEGYNVTTLTRTNFTNLYETGFPPPPPTPAPTPAWVGTTIIASLPQGFAKSGGIYGFLDSSPSGSASLMEGCYSFFLGQVPQGVSQYPTNTTGYGGSAFVSPRAIAGDSLGNFYVADTGNAYVEQFAAVCSVGPYTSPAWLHRWNAFNPTSPFKKPTALVCDSPAAGWTGNNIWVGDAGYSPSLIEAFGAGGTTLVASWTTIPNCVVNGLAVDQGSTCGGVAGPCVYVADSGNEQVEVYTSTGQLLREWGPPPAALHTVTLPFIPASIAIVGNPETSIIVGDAGGSNNLVVYGP
jgi:hypothetical protein